MAKYPHLYWTPCAAHCIDLILEDIAGLLVIDSVNEGNSNEQFYLSTTRSFEYDEAIHETKKLVKAGKDEICNGFYHTLINT